MATPNIELWTALDEANQSRARLYVEFFRLIEARLGRTEAIDICKAAIRNWGRGLAAGLARHGPSDFAELCKSFALAPDGGGMFCPKIGRCDEAGLDVEFERCPLQLAWRAAGLSDSDIELLCEIACEADHGAMEAAGFSVQIETWRAGRSGCCRLSIRPRDQE